MKVKIKRLTDINLVQEACDVTQSKNRGAKLSIKTWGQLLKTAHGVPHSPIRAALWRIYCYDVPYYVHVHLVRHHVGCQFYVRSQRPNKGRADAVQGELVDMIIDINANALIDMSKARLCNKADTKTCELMTLITDCYRDGCDYERCLAENMGPPCAIYNKCFEQRACTDV